MDPTAFSTLKSADRKSSRNQHLAMRSSEGSVHCRVFDNSGAVYSISENATIHFRQAIVQHLRWTPLISDQYDIFNDANCLTNDVDRVTVNRIYVINDHTRSTSESPRSISEPTHFCREPLDVRFLLLPHRSILNSIQPTHRASSNQFTTRKSAMSPPSPIASS